MIEFENKSPGFTAEGAEPPESLKAEGFKQGYKPPAAYFTWFWTLVSRCITEIQSILARAAKDDLTNVSDDTIRDKVASAGAGSVPIADAISTDGVAYSVTVDGVTELKNGLLLTIIPNMNSTSKSVTIDINGLGAKMLRIPLSFNTAAMTQARLENFFVEGRPVMIQYDANYAAGGMWKTVDKQRTSAQDLYGTVPVESGGTGNDKGRAASAEKLHTPRAIQVNLESESAADFDGTANVAPGVTGILPHKFGGTGSATARGAEYNILGSMTKSTNPVVAENRFVFFRSVPNETDGALVYKDASVVWEWIVQVMRTELGVTDIVCSETQPEYVEGRIWLKPID